MALANTALRLAKAEASDRKLADSKDLYLLVTISGSKAVAVHVSDRRTAYHRGAHWPERVEMAQWRTDHLDTPRKGAKVFSRSRPAAGKFGG